MHTQSLLDCYTTLCPGVRHLYVVPDIETVARHNTYLRLLYDEVRAAPDTPRITSSSLIPPTLVLRRALGERSVLHHHWFECDSLISFLHLVWKILWIGLYRVLGGKVVWTIHNPRPHHRRLPRLNGMVQRVWSRVPHRIHVHCNEELRIMSGVLGLGQERFFIHPHPPYPVRRMDALQARRLLQERYSLPQLTNDRRLFLMFGHIAEHKGILEAVQAFRRAGNGGVLCIAGAVGKHSANYFRLLQSETAGRPDIVLINRLIPEEDVPLFFNAADFVLFNYVEVMTSGGVVLAMNFGKRVIVPELGCLKEFGEDGVLKFRSQEDLADLLRALVSPL